MTTATTSNNYAMGRTAVESQRYELLLAMEAPELISSRLNEQHFIITSSIPNNARIADIGTGTAIWLVELASTLPSTCTFVGYDISSEQYPPLSSLPSNLTLRTRSFLDEFPESEKSAYDVVACRALISILAKEE
jgi:hypothetical protein